MPKTYYICISCNKSCILISDCVAGKHINCPIGLIDVNFREMVPEALNDALSLK